jgi:hypothetical protein
MDGNQPANIRFEEQGPVYNMTTVIHNISGRHIHDIGTSQSDDRQFLRTWRRQLQECLSHQNNRILKFLLADVSGEPDLISQRCNDVLAKYSRPTWNFASSMGDLDLSTVMNDMNEEITAELGGITPDSLRDAQKSIIRLYVSAAMAACAAEGRLEEKLKRLELVSGKINDMMSIEPTAELEGLEGVVRTYLDSILSKIDIESDYNELVRNYKKITMLKGLVSLQNLQRSAAPSCPICMTKEVSQVISPCGHTFCEDCCKNQMTACYICRVQVRDRIRLYFS